MSFNVPQSKETVKRTITQALGKWLASVLSAAPDGLQLFYVEWNDGRLGAKPRLFMNGCAYCMPQVLDPENPEHLGMLSDWSWETQEPCPLELAGADDEAIRRLFIDAVRRSRPPASLLETRKPQLIYGPHEGPVYMLACRLRMNLRRRSAPVPGRSHVRNFQRVRLGAHPSQFSRRCVRGHRT